MLQGTPAGAKGFLKVAQGRPAVSTGHSSAGGHPTDDVDGG